MFLELYHPTTNQRLDLFTPEVMELMRSGYSINDILNLSKKIPPKYNRDNIFTNDILLNYVKNLDLKDTKSLCLIDKGAQELYQSKYLWKVKIEYCISQQILLKNSKYIGNYTAHYYDIVLNAIGRSDLFDTEKDTFVFSKHKNLKIIFNHLVNYQPELYKKQKLKIEEKYYILRCFEENYSWEYKINKENYKNKYDNVYAFIFYVFVNFSDNVRVMLNSSF